MLCTCLPQFILQLSKLQEKYRKYLHKVEINSVSSGVEEYILKSIDPIVQNFWVLGCEKEHNCQFRIPHQEAVGNQSEQIIGTKPWRLHETGGAQEGLLSILPEVLCSVNEYMMQISVLHRVQ